MIIMLSLKLMDVLNFKFNI